MGRRRRQLGRTIAVGAVLVGFIISSAVTLIAIAHNNRAVQRLIVENVVWATVQLQVEASALGTALLRLDSNRTLAAADDALLRLDLVWSRLAVVESGEVADFLNTVDLTEPVADTRTALETIDGVVDTLADPSSPEFADAVTASLVQVESLLPVLRDWSVAVLHADRARILDYVAAREEATGWFRASFLGLLLSGVLVVILLLREVAAGNRKADQAQDALAQAAAAERRLVDAIAAIPEGFALYDRDDRLIIFNDRYKEIYAASAPAITPGARFEDILRYGAERGQYAEAAGRVEAWISERLDRHRNAKGPIEQRIAGNRWLRIEERPTSEGGVVGVRVDITDIKRAQQQLEQAEEAANLGHFLLDVPTQRIVPSAHLVTLLGGDNLGPLDTWPAMLARIDPDDRPTIDHLVAGVLNSGEEAQAIVTTVLIAGRSRSASVLIRPQSAGNGGPSALFGTVQDITRQRDVEAQLAAAKDEALAANEAKSRFLSIMSHEIRTPMNGIVGSLNLIDLAALPGAEADRIALAQSSAERLGRVLNDILDFSRIESGRLALASEAFDPQALAREAVAFWKPSAQEKGLSLVCLIQDAVPERLEGDPGRLRQVLDNLLSNAIKFSDAGMLTVRLSSAGSSGNGAGEGSPDIKRLRMAVSDQGRGIAPDDRSRVFVDFSQLHSTRGMDISGSGLGLAICQRLVELMGGQIDFESGLGVGTTFWVEVPLPVAPDDAAVSHEQPVAGFSANTRLDGLRVLVAEDNETNQIVMEQTLASLGCSVRLVTDGRQAVDALSAESFDAVLMDISMPVMDGPTATRVLRKRYGPGLLIVACTAYALTEDHQRFADAGFDAVIAKPISKPALARVLDGLAKRDDPINGPMAGSDAERVKHAAEAATPRNAAGEEPPAVLFDLEVINGLRENLDAETFAALCDRFRSDVGRCIDEIGAAGPTGREAIANSTHRLIGVAGTVGASALSEAAIALYHEAADADRLPSSVSKVCQLGDETLAGFDAILGKANLSSVAPS